MFILDSQKVRPSLASAPELANWRPSGQQAGKEILAHRGQSGVLDRSAPEWQKVALAATPEGAQIRVQRSAFSGRTSFFLLAAASAEEFEAEVVAAAAAAAAAALQFRVSGLTALTADQGLVTPDGDILLVSHVETRTVFTTSGPLTHVVSGYADGQFIAVPWGTAVVTF